jgi:hypothetical protein
MDDQAPLWLFGGPGDPDQGRHLPGRAGLADLDEVVAQEKHRDEF